MCDRYLGSLHPDANTGNAQPADEGPEGPPNHASGAITA